VKAALEGHGTPSAGPVSPHHWAFSGEGTTFSFQPRAAADVIARVPGGLAFTCVTPPDARYEHLGLVLKQQLHAVGIEMTISEVPAENVIAIMGKPGFEALLVDAASGWSLMRAYRWWHSKGNQNAMKYFDAAVDSALDRVRHATNDSAYQAAVADFQRAINDDPPAIFLAWGDRSRAVSRKFAVEVQEGRDVLATLRMWHPSADTGNASKN
jgi:ABC-type transport system substrate-binding protein